EVAVKSQRIAELVAANDSWRLGHAEAERRCHEISVRLQGEIDQATGARDALAAEVERLRGAGPRFKVGDRVVASGHEALATIVEIDTTYGVAWEGADPSQWFATDWFVAGDLSPAPATPEGGGQ